jgi:hypothetical protein
MGKISAKDLGIRLILITVVGLITLTSYFVYSNYTNFIKTSEAGILTVCSTVNVKTRAN